MTNFQKILTEGTETKQSPERRLMIQQFQAKLAGLESHLEALISKKIRIDLEIKKVKRVLSKTKHQSQVYLKTSVMLENTLPDDPTIEELNSFLESKDLDLELFRELLNSLEKAEHIFDQIEELDSEPNDKEFQRIDQNFRTLEV